jgi:hypothetical protein
MYHGGRVAAPHNQPGKKIMSKESEWYERGNNFKWAMGLMLAAIALVSVGIWATSDSQPDNWKPCNEAMQVRLYQPDFDVTSISWEKQGGGTEVARGTVHSQGETFSFECGVTNGDLAWLDVS